MWSRAKDFILEEIYTEFVPKWFKKKQKKGLRTNEISDWLVPSLKIGTGVGLCPLATVLDIGGHEPIMAGIGLYVAADGIYQLINLMSYNTTRKAGTLLLDALTYPIYLISSRVRH